MATIKFEDYKDQILEKLKEHLKTIPLNGNFTLIDGFFNQPIQKELSGAIIIGGPTVPMVAIVENNTGQMHFLAVKILIPTIGA